MVLPRYLSRAVLAIGILCLASWLAGEQPYFTAKVIGVKDGDTIEVLKQKTTYTIRLSHIDAPEKRQAFGTRAKQFVSEQCYGQQVRIYVDGKDRYGRTLGVVYVLSSEKNLNKEIIKSGYAWWYRKYSKDESYGRLETEAKKRGVGLWQDENPVPPWEYRPLKSAKQEVVSGNQNKWIYPYHGNRYTHVFHSAHCEWYNCKNCVVGFQTTADAITDGYRGCALCKP